MLTNVTIIMQPLLHEGFFLAVCTIVYAHPVKIFPQFTIYWRLNKICNHSVKSWLWRFPVCVLLQLTHYCVDCELMRASPIGLALFWQVVSLHLNTSNRAPRHYSDDHMSVKERDVSFISIVSGACICSLLLLLC